MFALENGSSSGGTFPCTAEAAVDGILIGSIVRAGEVVEVLIGSSLGDYDPSEGNPRDP